MSVPAVISAVRGRSSTVRGVGFGRALAVVAILGLALRMATVANLGGVAGLVDGDQTYYLELARRLADGQPYSTVNRVPGYPVFAGVMLAIRDLIGIGWSDRSAIGVGQALLGTATVVLTGLLGRRLRGGAVGLVAALLVAVWPSLVLMTAVVLSETLFIALFMAAMTVLFWRDEPTRLHAAAVGALLGGAYLVRFVAAVPLAVAAVWLVRCYGRRAWPWVWRLVAAAAVVILPWVARNALKYDELVPADASGGYSWCMGNHDGARPDATDNTYCIEGLPGESSVEFDRRLTRRALGWIADNPGEFAGMVPERAGHLVATDHDAVTELNGHDPTAARWSDADAALISDRLDTWWRSVRWIALGGAVLLARERRSRWLLLVGASVLTPPLLAAVAPRYHLPVVPIMAIAVAVLAHEVVRRVRRRRAEHPKVETARGGGGGGLAAVEP